MVQRDRNKQPPRVISILNSILDLGARVHWTFATAFRLA